MLERSPLPHRQARFGALVRRVLSWPARVAEARRTLTLLGRMTDRELLDIGLLRSDVAHCAALPLDEDPSHKLAQVRACRAWFAPRRTTAPKASAAMADRAVRGRDGEKLTRPEHGDRSEFVMDNLTNIRWTDQ